MDSMQTTQSGKSDKQGTFRGHAWNGTCQTGSEDGPKVQRFEYCITCALTTSEEGLRGLNAASSEQEQRWASFFYSVRVQIDS